MAFKTDSLVNWKLLMQDWGGAARERNGKFSPPRGRWTGSWKSLQRRGPQKRVSPFGPRKKGNVLMWRRRWHLPWSFRRGRTNEEAEESDSRTSLPLQVRAAKLLSCWSSYWVVQRSWTLYGCLSTDGRGVGDQSRRSISPQSWREQSRGLLGGGRHWVIMKTFSRGSWH